MPQHDHIRKLILFIISVSMLTLSACATIDPDFADPRDPLESFNRTIHSFNETVDDAILQPISEGYVAVTPEPVDKGITNFFNNLRDINSILNNLLQFKLHAAMQDASRVLINSFFGIVGIFDIATDLEIPRHNEDFGQTLGHWGIGAGPYLVLPLLGPSSGRDLFGRIGDMASNPLGEVDLNTDTRLTLNVVNSIDTRAGLLETTRLMKEAALGDTYSFLRDSYLQKRLNDVHDGNPPDQEERF